MCIWPWWSKKKRSTISLLFMQWVWLVIEFLVRLCKKMAKLNRTTEQKIYTYTHIYIYEKRDFYYEWNWLPYILICILFMCTPCLQNERTYIEIEGSQFHFYKIISFYFHVHTNTYYTWWKSCFHKKKRST